MLLEHHKGEYEHWTSDEEEDDDEISIYEETFTSWHNRTAREMIGLGNRDTNVPTKTSTNQNELYQEQQQETVFSNLIEKETDILLL